MVSGPASFAPRFKARAIDLYRLSEGAGAVDGAGIGTIRPVSGSAYETIGH